MSVQPADLNDPALVTEVDLARAAAQQEAGDERVGDHVSYHVEDEAAVTHLFEADKSGYHGWRWAVTITSAGPDTDVTVSEVVLLPGPSALVAPDWIPWQQRVQAGDLGVGDLLPTAPDDPRLVPAYVESDDPAVEEVATDVGLGRARVMARPARLEAAARWHQSEFGPRSDMARSAPAHCATCAFYLPLAGSLRAAFGTCGNELSPADAHVVHAEYGCGAHSEAEVEQVSPVLVADLIYDDAQLDVEPLEPGPSGSSGAADEPAAAAEPTPTESAVAPSVSSAAEPSVAEGSAETSVAAPPEPADAAASESVSGENAVTPPVASVPEPVAEESGTATSVSSATESSVVEQTGPVLPEPPDEQPLASVVEQTGPVPSESPGTPAPGSAAEQSVAEQPEVLDAPASASATEPVVEPSESDEQALALAAEPSVVEPSVADGLAGHVESEPAESLDVPVSAAAEPVVEPSEVPGEPSAEQSVAGPAESLEVAAPASAVELPAVGEPGPSESFDEPVSAAPGQSLPEVSDEPGPASAAEQSVPAESSDEPTLASAVEPPAAESPVAEQSEMPDEPASASAAEQSIAQEPLAVDEVASGESAVEPFTTAVADSPEPVVQSGAESSSVDAGERFGTPPGEPVGGEQSATDATTPPESATLSGETASSAVSEPGASDQLVAFPEIEASAPADEVAEAAEAEPVAVDVDQLAAFPEIGGAQAVRDEPVVGEPAAPDEEGGVRPAAGITGAEGTESATYDRRPGDEET